MVMDLERLINDNLHGPSSFFDVFLTLSCGSSSSSSSEQAAAAGTPPALVAPPLLLLRGRRRRRRRRGQQAFECRTCGREFPTFQALGGHRTSHLRLRRPPAMTKKKKKAAVLVHACAACGLGFSTGQALGGHMRTHRVNGPSTTEEDEVGCGGPAAGFAMDLARAVVLHERPSSTASLQLLDLFV